MFPELDGIERADQVFATIVAIAILTAEFRDQAPAWTMIEKKAIKWLGLRHVEFEPLRARAIAELSK
jgi:hypothetical protein